MAYSALRVLAFVALCASRGFCYGADEFVHLWHDQDCLTSLWLQKNWADLESSRKIVVNANVDAEAAFYQMDPKTDPLPDAVLVASNLTALHSTFHFSAVPPDLLQGLSKKSKSSVFIDGQFFGVPLFISDLLVFYYNKKRVPQPLQDLAQLKAPLEMSWPFATPYYVAPFLSAWKAWPQQFSRQELTSTLFANRFEDALSNYVDLVRETSIDASCDARCSWDRFISGKAAYAIAGASKFESAVKTWHEALGVAPLPFFQGHRLRPFFASYCLVFPFHSLSGPHGIILKRFLKKLLSQKEQASLSQKGRLPVRDLAWNSKEASPANLVAWEELQTAQKLGNNPRLSVFWPALRKTLTVRSQKDYANVKASPLLWQLFSNYEQHWAVENAKRALER